MVRIGISLPYLFSVRDFLFTNALKEMEDRKGVEFVFLLNNAVVIKYINSLEIDNVRAIPINFSYPSNTSIIKKLFEFPAKWVGRETKYLFDNFLFYSLLYRFSAVNKLPHYFTYKGKSLKERLSQKTLSEYHHGINAGFPFPESKLLFYLFYRIEHYLLNIPWKNDLHYIDTLNLDLFVFGRLQMVRTKYWISVFKKLSIPSLGIISSWDHPTTKGPLPPGLHRYIVASRRMKEELINLHSIKAEKIHQVGKVQMDIYKDSKLLMERSEFLESIGVPKDHLLVTMGTNTTGLKEHEISIAKYLARKFMQGVFGKVSLFIRTHPQDKDWIRDFKSLEHKHLVVCKEAYSFSGRSIDEFSQGREDQVFLANLMKHSNVVIQSRGSLALDAAAFDTPVISLAFDGDLDRKESDSFLLEYNHAHYMPIVITNGTWMTHSYDNLGLAIQTYLNNPELHSKGRQLIRENQIEPFDGKTAKRVIDVIVNSAINLKRGDQDDGDWKHKGLGNTEWSLSLERDARDYLRNQ